MASPQKRSRWAADIVGRNHIGCTVLLHQTGEDLLGFLKVGAARNPLPKVPAKALAKVSPHKSPVKTLVRMMIFVNSCHVFSNFRKVPSIENGRLTAQVKYTTARWISSPQPLTAAGWLLHCENRCSGWKSSGWQIPYSGGTGAVIEPTVLAWWVVLLKDLAGILWSTTNNEYYQITTGWLVSTSDPQSKPARKKPRTYLQTASLRKSLT